MQIEFKKVWKDRKEIDHMFLELDQFKGEWLTFLHMTKDHSLQNFMKMIDTFCSYLLNFSFVMSS